MDSDFVAIGSKIKVLRKMHDITQEKLAEALGVEPDHIASVERGRTSLSLKRLISCCRYFNVELTDLVSITKVDDTEIKKQWIEEILTDLNKLDTQKIGQVKMIVHTFVGE